MIVQGRGNGAGIRPVIGLVQILEDQYKASSSVRAGITFGALGRVVGVQFPVSGPSVYDWLNAGSPADYQIYCQVNSGSVSGASRGTWLSMTTDRTWSNGSSFTQAIITISIRSASTLAVLASAQIKFLPA